METAIPEAWRALNATQRDILVLLAIDAPRTGTEINRRLEASAEDSPVAYRNLTELREQTLVRSKSGPESTANELTPAGRDLVRAAVVDTARLVETAEVLG